jgi:hypothetical protein
MCSHRATSLQLTVNAFQDPLELRTDATAAESDM